MKYSLVKEDKKILDFEVVEGSFKVLELPSKDLLSLLSPLVVTKSDVVSYLESRRIPERGEDRAYLFGKPFKGLDYEVHHSYLTNWEDGVFARPIESNMTFSDLERFVYGESF